MKKTDWQIARGLADWVSSLGLEEGKHQKWNGLELPYTTDEDYVQTYAVNGFVSLECYKDGEKINELNIHSTSFGNSFGLSEKVQTPEALLQEVQVYIDSLNIRYWNKVYRNKLRFLEAQAEARREQAKQAKIERLKKEINNLEEAK